MKLLTQSLSLFFACLVVFVITSTPLDDYKAPIIGFLIVISVITTIIRQRTLKKSQDKNQDIFSGSGIEVGMVTVIVLLVIFQTGGLSSSLFFFLYFLLFGIVFLFQPEVVFVLAISMVILFLTSLGNGDMATNIIKVGSIAFLSPIAYFFGREFKRREKIEDEVNDKTGQILEDAQTLLEHTKNEDAINEVNDIIEKSNELRKQADKD